MMCDHMSCGGRDCAWCDDAEKKSLEGYALTPAPPVAPALPVVAVGINQRDALRLAKALGADVAIARRTGEVVVSHPRVTLKVRINSRRKDTPRALVVWLRRLLETSSTSSVPA